MTIYVYPSPMPGEPLETHEWEGCFADWLAEAGLRVDHASPLPVSVHLNGAEFPAGQWAVRTLSAADRLEIRVLPRGGVFSGIGRIISKVFNIFFGWLMPSTKNNRRDTPTGQSLETSEAKANTAKLNAIVPEVAGRHIRYPEYLTPPRRYFASPRQQFLEMLLCIGPGQYQIDGGQVKIGNTALASLAGAEFYIYPPGADVSAHGLHEHLYPCPEVGGTSAGTAGLELSSTPSANIAPASPTYNFDGAFMSAAAPWPEGWGVGTRTAIKVKQNYSVAVVDVGSGEFVTIVNEFTGSWKEVAPTVGAMLEGWGPVSGQVYVDAATLDVNGFGTLRLSRMTEEGLVPISDQPAGTISNAFNRPGRTYQVAAMGAALQMIAVEGGAAVPGWAGWPTLTGVAAANVEFVVDPATIFGDWTGPFAACPVNETTTAVFFDVFFPNGLVRIEDDGGLASHSVSIEVQWRDANAGGAWNSTSRGYTQATMDQIGFTETLNFGSAIRPEVRMRRVGALSTSTQINDVVQWYAMRSRLPTRVTYPDWTTMGVRIRGLGNISANSENQVNVVATRMLPTLRSDGTWSGPEPTRDISAFVKYIAGTIGYTDAELDIAELLRLHNLWVSRGETVDYVFDETTVKQAIATCFAAGMAELTVEDGQLRPVRDGVRTQWEQSYSAQNTLGPIVRSFTTPRPDDNDGVQIEYVDAADSWTTKTVNCLLPGSPGIKLEKIKVSGVTDRTRAWRIGMRRTREQRYQRWNYSFSTEMDAMNSSYGSYVALVPDIPEYGRSAIIERVEASGTNAVFHLSEPIEWTAGQSHVLAFRRPDGKLQGPYAATLGADGRSLIAAVPPAERPRVNLKQEPPHAYYGTVARWSFPALMRQISPGNGGTTRAQAVNYDPRVYASDDALIS